MLDRNPDTLNDARHSPSVMVPSIIHIDLLRWISNSAYEVSVASSHKREKQK